MIITFYDKDFTALQENSSLNVGNSWELKRKAVDFDDFTATSEAFLEDINPTFVVLQTDLGRYKYGAFAGVPTLNSDNQTEIQASDLKTIHNNQVLLNFNSDDTSSLTYTLVETGTGTGTYTTLYELLTYIFAEFYTQVIDDSFEIEYDLTEITDIAIDNLYPDTGIQVYSLWDDLLETYFKYYGVYMDSKLDIANKKLIFTVHKTDANTKALHLYDFGEKNYGKWVASVNKCWAVVYDTSTGICTKSDKWILNSNNEIGLEGKIDEDLYPTKNKISYQETDDTDEVSSLLQEGVIECIENLADARYNESIEIQVNGTVYEEDGFDTNYDVYLEQGNHDKYKTLPIGEIDEKGDGTITFTVGYKDDDIVIYI